MKFCGRERRSPESKKCRGRGAVRPVGSGWGAIVRWNPRRAHVEAGSRDHGTRGCSSPESRQTAEGVASAGDSSLLSRSPTDSGGGTNRLLRAYRESVRGRPIAELHYCLAFASRESNRQCAGGCLRERRRLGVPFRNSKARFGLDFKWGTGD
ncbi:hypothetical protein ACJRO7_028632 [Eucalyptus globulus]|uniref:Uncharacterized protein n=1 Tax=Eucalyptus globulus TaxID=34317 RepID=A0ABD3JVS4_EUCGL